MFEQDTFHRRKLLFEWAHGFGGLALLSLMSGCDRPAAAPAPLAHAPRKKAKSVIFLFMDGGPSQMDTFDPKPRLTREHGQPIKIKIVNRLASNTVLKSPFKFQRYGQCGADVSELFPHVATCVDDMTIIRSMVADNVEHGSATLMMATGSALSGRPSMGSWIHYALGSEASDLPGYVVMHGGELPHVGVGSLGNGFLPAKHQCTLFSPLDKQPFGDIQRWEATDALQKAKLPVLARLNQFAASELGASSELESSVANYEMAYRLQSSLPKLIDYSDESAATQSLYGIDDAATRAFGIECLLARKMVEKGVRFINLIAPVVPEADRWDQHSNLKVGLTYNCQATDKPIAGLLKDLKARGLLDETLVIWGGEFGRTATAEFQEGKDPGREHNPFGFTMWLAGGGAQRGLVYGATDEYGYHAVENPVHVHDLHATILHLLGIDHTQLTFRHGGRDYRLTDVYGNVMHDLLA
ncbi:MAG: DUF1501 domain-containing protein [Pirellulales bacterium]|nr:DUF1501 domain-containing protein [Pirellulales bacterium]